MSSITRDLARYRRRVTLTQTSQSNPISASAEQREHFLACLANGNPNGYTEFSVVPPAIKASCK